MRRDTSKKSLTYNVQVLGRAFSILEAFSRNRGELGVADLTRMVRLPKSTVHRLVMILERHGYLEKSPFGGRYRLGSRVIQLGMLALNQLDLKSTATPYLERLAAETGETAHLGILRDGEIISLVHAQGRHILRMPSTVGRRIPAHCTSLGKAIMAFLPKEEIEKLTAGIILRRYTPKTLIKPSLLMADLRRVRKLGYATDNEEFEKGLKCIGAPVRDHMGRVIAAISIAMPAFRMEKGRVPELTREVLKSAEDLSSALGSRQKSAADSRRNGKVA